MNAWLIIILLIILTHYLVDSLVSIVNLRALSPELPKEFGDYFDEEKYRSSQDYTRATTKLALLENSFTTGVTLVFLLLGGFNVVDLFSRSFGLGPIRTGIVFTGSLLFLSFIIGLPFNLYSTFSIETRFGFNRTSVITYITDLLKGFGLSIVFGVPLLSFILWFFETSPVYGWLYCWIGVVLFTIVMQFLAPVLIMPLFNKFIPLEDGPLYRTIMAYARQEDFGIKGIFTMDGSRRSTKLNAFFTGFGRFRKIVFYDTLVEKLSDAEILAVLAHEMGHFKKKHILRMMVLTILQTGLMFYLLSLFIGNPGLFEAFGMNQISIYASLVFFAFLYSPLNTLLSIFTSYLSRAHEFEADEYAARSTGREDMLIQGLKKLSSENLSNLTPHPLMVLYSYSHPPVLERIKHLQKTTF
jgi:STE24 endopeptidase